MQYLEYLAIVERSFFQEFIQLLDIYDSVIQYGKVEEYIKAGFDGRIVGNKITEINCDRLIGG